MITISNEIEFYENPASSGSEMFYQTTILRSLIASEGVFHLFEHLKCYWIGDIVGSYLSHSARIFKNNGDQDLFVIKVVRDDMDTAEFIIEGRDGRVIIELVVDAEDLKQNVKLFLQMVHKRWTMLLPTECKEG